MTGEVVTTDMFYVELDCDVVSYPEGIKQPLSSRNMSETSFMLEDVLRQGEGYMLPLKYKPT